MSNRGKRSSLCHYCGPDFPDRGPPAQPRWLWDFFLAGDWITVTAVGFVSGRVSFSEALSDVFDPAGACETRLGGSGPPMIDGSSSRIATPDAGRERLDSARCEEAAELPVYVSVTNALYSPTPPQIPVIH
jgi:hypothetical protein